MNDIMSLGLHRYWKQQTLNFVNPKKGDVFLDLAGGTGDISLIIKKKFPENKCILLDKNKKMIEQARQKLFGHKVEFVNSDAEKIPFKNPTFDFTILAFGLRNFSEISTGLDEIFRTMNENGKFICLEFSQINSLWFQKIYNYYSKLIPFFGKVIANNQDAYKYLVKSIEIFPNQLELSKMIKNSGFKKVDCYDLFDGIASIHIGLKLK